MTNQLAEPIEALWRLPPPTPDGDSTYQTDEFRRLLAVCRADYAPTAGDIGLTFALGNALRRFGLPMNMPETLRAMSLPAGETADRLDAAFRSSRIERVHMVPLNCADDLPPMAFGPCRIGRFDASQLEVAMGGHDLARAHPEGAPCWRKLAQLQWLSVREEVSEMRDAGTRAVPWLTTLMTEDRGRIEPHRRSLPSAVEDALFMLLLAPWEERVSMPTVDWRSFQAPWVHTVEGDVFVTQKPVPSYETLAWETASGTRFDGTSVEYERPVRLPLKEGVEPTVPLHLNDIAWDTFIQARGTDLCGMPVVHFLVRAFLADGIDEFLAHVTTVEAALGIRSDYNSGKRSADDHPDVRGATARVAARVSGLLGQKADGADFRMLFDLRSGFLHGRNMDDIPTETRVLARSVARRVALGVVSAAALKAGDEREAYLHSLLTKGKSAA